MAFAELDNLEVDITDWEVTASEGYADMTNVEYIVHDGEIGNILDESEFLDWCKGQGMVISKKDDGEVIIETRWDMNDAGGISPRP